MMMMMIIVIIIIIMIIIIIIIIQNEHWSRTSTASAYYGGMWTLPPTRVWGGTFGKCQQPLSQG